MSESESSKRGYQQTKRDQEQGVSPWDVEYKPNPVIFAHLAEQTSSPQPQRLEHEDFANLTHPHESETVPALSLVDTSSSSADNAINSSDLPDSGSSQTSEDDRSTGAVAGKLEENVNE